MSLLPYIKLMRLHQRTGIWLLLWPCWWSITLAAGGIIDKQGLLLLFLVGAIVMRSAGCVINDIFDRKIDAQVERTKNRPLASGMIGLKQALILLALLLATGLAILLTLNRLTILLGVGFAVMVMIYPLMKRVIKIPQIFLGLTFNAGALMGWSSVAGALPPPAWLLYAACFFWTLGYDTIYAHQDKKDDEKIGIKSAALAFGSRSKIYITVCYLLTAILLTAAGYMHGQAPPYYLGVGVTLVVLLWQIISVKLDDAKDCMDKFRCNGMLGWIMPIGIAAG